MSGAQKIPPCTNGLLIFQSLPASGGGLVQVIGEATDSHITHIGIVRKKGDQCVIEEAIGSQVHETPIQQFLNRSQYNWFKSVSGWSSGDIQRFINEASKFLGEPYDFEFRHDKPINLLLVKYQILL